MQVLHKSVTDYWHQTVFVMRELVSPRMSAQQLVLEIIQCGG